MYWVQNIIIYIHSFFDFLSCKTKPKYDQINDIENNNQEYEFILNQTIER